MKYLKYLLWSTMILSLVFASSRSGFSQSELTLISPASTRTAMDQIVPEFQRKTGYKVNVTFGNGGKNIQQVANGATFDVAILEPPYPEVLSSNNVVANSATTIASLPIGVAVKQGAPKPDLSTPESVKRTLLAAKSIFYPDASGGAVAGLNFDTTLKKLGIVDQMEPKKIKGGPSAIASADLYITFLSEMVAPGIDIIGPLPSSISTPTPLVAFVSAHSKDSAAAKALVDYLRSSDAATVYKAHWMLPGA